MNRGTPEAATNPLPSAVWSAASASDRCVVQGVQVADYVPGTGMPANFSPRPYLHPVRTLLGVSLTEVEPADHAHHYGLSLAIPDVDGTSYWGGRTFVSGQGSTMLANHGQQRVIESTRTGPKLTQELHWFDEDDRLQLTETRVIEAAALHAETGWSLTWTSVLRAAEHAVTIGSPATNGRPGAGYGGIFWRLPHRDATHVLTASGAGEAAAHESSSPWLAINQTAGAHHMGLLLSQPEATRTRWFLRSTQYVGAGPMLAAERRVTIAPDEPLTTSLSAVLLDRWIDDAADAEQLHRAAERLHDDPPFDPLKGTVPA